MRRQNKWFSYKKLYLLSLASKRLLLLLYLDRRYLVKCSNILIKNTSRHEDIREAMLSLVHMIRMSEDKLERHEFRERTLGDQLKKMLIGLDKKHRALEPLKGMISRLDDRLSNVETILLQVRNYIPIKNVLVNDCNLNYD